MEGLPVLLDEDETGVDVARLLPEDPLFKPQEVELFERRYRVQPYRGGRLVAQHPNGNPRPTRWPNERFIRTFKEQPVYG